MTTYLDNAATTYPKPASVYEAVLYAMEQLGATPGRAAHRMAREASAVVAEAREKVARLLDIPIRIESCSQKTPRRASTWC